MRKISFLCLAVITFLNTSFGQNLPRRAGWEADIQSPAANVPGATIESVEAGSPLAKAGIASGDIILTVNGRLVNSTTWADIDYSIRGDEVTTLLVKRAAKSRVVEVRFNSLAKETHDYLDTYYESFTNSYGLRQRAIITKPKNASGRQPAIYMIGGLSCSSMELYPGRTGNWARVINDLVEKTGMVVMRIDKPGVGDSQGACGETDFDTELDGIREGIKLLKSKDYVDTSRIVVYGSSMGSAIAPVMANEFDLAAVISDGVFFKTWYEHMLEIERRIKRMQGNSETQIAKLMNEAYIPLYYGMLIQKKTYEEVTNEYPEIKEHNYHGARHMYGRPVSYYQQLQDFDFAGAWEKIKVPVRIMRGTNDWIMSSFDNHMIIEVLKRNGHTDHLLYEYPGLDHWNTIHERPDDSFLGNPGKWEDDISGIFVEWAKELAGLG